ncbi:MAG TPA: hypothetical protein RMH99_11170 [Sandaracinaceae bacterium LLY-WYZ-13_1]|nr:hypothetical protein [Sandaracinaceae bacterium LLY-WYZ-13_1]
MTSRACAGCPTRGRSGSTGGTALVGVDGWADARHGQLEGSPVRLRDYQHVEDLARHDFEPAVEVARSLADRDAATLRGLLEEALAARPRVLVATHVPPFPEAARYGGEVTHPHFLPWVTCKATGDVLLEVAARHPEGRLTVLCGHMHHPAEVAIRDNLEVRCGAAEYGRPVVQAVLEL